MKFPIPTASELFTEHLDTAPQLLLDLHRYRDSDNDTGLRQSYSRELFRMVAKHQHDGPILSRMMNTLTDSQFEAIALSGVPSTIVTILANPDIFPWDTEIEDQTTLQYIRELYAILLTQVEFLSQQYKNQRDLRYNDAIRILLRKVPAIFTALWKDIQKHKGHSFILRGHRTVFVEMIYGHIAELVDKYLSLHAAFLGVSPSTRDGHIAHILLYIWITYEDDGDPGYHMNRLHILSDWSDLNTQKALFHEISSQFFAEKAVYRLLKYLRKMHQYPETTEIPLMMFASMGSSTDPGRHYYTQCQKQFGNVIRTITIACQSSLCLARSKRRDGDIGAITVMSAFGNVGLITLGMPEKVTSIAEARMYAKQPEAVVIASQVLLCAFFLHHTNALRMVGSLLDRFVNTLRSYGSQCIRNLSHREPGPIFH
ncbi:hypothetical protein ABKN59_005129 [Abortiporus biennis]